MNCYGDLSTLKSRLDITGTTNDTQLVKLLNAASRQIDQLTDRWFYVKTEARYYDGGTPPFFIDDLLSVTSIKLDEDGDGTFEVTMATDDYLLYPLNTYPKLFLKIPRTGDYGSFASGIQRGVELTGDFGYGDGESAAPYTATAITVTADNATETTLDVSEEGTIAAGHTILVGSEIIYVSAATSDNSDEITVTRGVNGSSAAAHAAVAASIYQYPDEIMEACYVQAMRWWKRKDTAFQDQTAMAEYGQVVVYKGLDPDVQLMINGYKRKIGAF